MSQRALGCYRCGILNMPLSPEVYHGAPEYSDVPCSAEAFSLTAGNWVRHHTDQSIQNFITGGRYSDEIYWVQLLLGPLHSHWGRQLTNWERMTAASKIHAIPSSNATILART